MRGWVEQGGRHSENVREQAVDSFFVDRKYNYNCLGNLRGGLEAQHPT